MVSRITAVAVGALMLFGAATASADDAGGLGYASPGMLPGEDAGMLQSMVSAARFTATQSVANDMQVVVQPQAYSSCLSNLMLQAQELVDMFDDGFSISAVISSFAQIGITKLLTSLENEVCAAAGQLMSALNGMTVGGSVTNLFGTGAGLTFSVSLAPASNNPNQTPSTNAGAAGTQTPAQASSQLDDLDAIANSGGVSLTAMSPPPAGGVTSSTVDNTNPSPPTPVAMVDAGIPNMTPQNATVCIPPDNKSYLSHSSGTSDYPDSQTPTTSSYMDNGDGTNASLQNFQAALLAMQPPSTLTPPPTDAPPTNGASQANIPAGQSGTSPVSCQPGTTNSKPGYISTGTPCTAKDKVQCIAGSGCSPQNGGIGVAKYDQNFVMGGPPFGQGTANFGACAMLTEDLVPNVGNTSGWNKGPAVQGNTSLQFGTPVATMFGGGGSTYKNPEPSAQHPIQHTGIYLGQTSAGMFILEQWVGSPPHERIYPWSKAGRPVFTGGTATRDDEGSAQNYYVIVH